MREIIRPEVLWREVIPLAVVAGIVALVFIIALVNEDDLDGATGAVAWTMQLSGALIATIAAFGLFWRALNGEPLELQFGYVLALIAGLLLVDIHWSLAIALAVIGVALIVRGIMAHIYPAVGDATNLSPVDTPRIG